jgi:hypothetical protein
MLEKLQPQCADCQQRLRESDNKDLKEKNANRPPRPYFARLDLRRDLKKQMASRMVQFLCAESDEDGRVVYMRMYHRLHGNRYRDRKGEDVWAEALKYLGRAIRRKNGLIWLDGTKVVPDLPPPYKPLPKLKHTRKRKPRTAWYRDVALRAEKGGMSISEQVAADRQGRSRCPAVHRPSSFAPI